MATGGYPTLHSVLRARCHRKYPGRQSRKPNRDQPSVSLSAKCRRAIGFRLEGSVPNRAEGRCWISAVRWRGAECGPSCGQLLSTRCDPSVSLKFNPAFFWRESTSDGLYSIGASVIISGLKSDARYIATPASTQLRWKMTRNLIRLLELVEHRLQHTPRATVDAGCVAAPRMKI